MCGITRKGIKIRENILRCLSSENNPLSTHQLSVKLHYSWHSVQQRCLELLVQKKILAIETAGAHLWILKKTAVTTDENITPSHEFNMSSNNEFNKEITEELEQQIKKLTEELGKIKNEDIKNKPMEKEKQIEETL